MELAIWKSQTKTDGKIYSLSVFDYAPITYLQLQQLDSPRDVTSALMLSFYLQVQTVAKSLNWNTSERAAKVC